VHEKGKSTVNAEPGLDPPVLFVTTTCVAPTAALGTCTLIDVSVQLLFRTVAGSPPIVTPEAPVPSPKFVPVITIPMVGGPSVIERRAIVGCGNTITLTVPIAGLKSVASVGVKVTLSDTVPAAGAVLGVVKAKLPGTEAVPPVNVEEARVCPKVMLLAVGNTVIVGVALFTVTLTVPVTAKKFVVSVGVKVTLCSELPAGGAVVGVVKAKLPGTAVVPPLNVEEASVCPKVIALAVGHTLTVGIIVNPAALLEIPLLVTTTLLAPSAPLCGTRAVIELIPQVFTIA